MNSGPLTRPLRWFFVAWMSLVYVWGLSSLCGLNEKTLYLIEHVSRCIGDRTLPLFPAEDGFANVAACAAVLEACQRGGAIDVSRS